MKAYKANFVYFFLSTIPEKTPCNSANQPQRQIQEGQGSLDTPSAKLCANVLGEFFLALPLVNDRI